MTRKFNSLISIEPLEVAHAFIFKAVVVGV